MGSQPSRTDSVKVATSPPPTVLVIGASPKVAGTDLDPSVAGSMATRSAAMSTSDVRGLRTCSGTVTSGEMGMRKTGGESNVSPLGPARRSVGVRIVPCRPGGLSTIRDFDCASAAHASPLVRSHRPATDKLTATHTNAVFLIMVESSSQADQTRVTECYTTHAELYPAGQ